MPAAEKNPIMEMNLPFHNLENRKQRRVLAFEKANQNTQEDKNELLFKYRQDKTMCEFSVSKLELCDGGSFSKCDLQQRSSAKYLLLFVFPIRLSVCRFVKGNFNVCRKFAPCFVLSILKKHSFLTSRVFWFVIP